MTYNVFGGTLNLTQSIDHLATVLDLDMRTVWLASSVQM